MKFHLPKKLMLAVLAAMVGAAAPQTQAAIKIATPVKVDKIDTDVTWTELPDELMTTETVVDANNVEYVKPYVKDGEGTLTIDGVKGVDSVPYVTAKAPLFIREGQAILKDSYLIYAPENPQDGSSVVFQVGGKNASLVMDGAIYSNSYALYDEPKMNGAYVTVGGGNGAGKLVMKNGSRLSAAYTMLAGYGQDSDWYGYYIPASTTVTTDPESGRYEEGEYVYNAKVDRYYGAADITVEDGSKIELGSAFFAAQANITINGKDSCITDGHVYGEETACAFARLNGSTTNVTITNGGYFGAGQLLTGDYWGAYDNTANIVVDGAGSKLGAKSLIYLGYGSKDGAKNNGTTRVSIQVLNGGTMEAPSVALGQFATNAGESETSITVDNKSSIVAETSLYLGASTTMDNAGTVSSPNIYLNSGSTVNLTGGTGTLNISYIEMYEGSAISYEVPGTASENAPITFDPNIEYSGFAYMEKGSTFELIFTDAFTKAIEGSESTLTLKVLIASGFNKYSTIDSSLSYSGLDLAWEISENGLTWEKTETGLYVTGSLSKKEVIKVPEDGKVSSDITDGVGKKVVLDINGKENVTISGDNSHTGGTQIKGSEVTLGSEKALGAGVVTTAGETILSTGNGVTAKLPEAIQNSGDLTISGSYDGSTLKEIDIDATRICVNGEEGDNGFQREGGSALLVVVNNKDEATLTVEDGTTVKGSEGDLKLYASGLATNAEVDYSNYHIEDDEHEASVSAIQGMRPDSTEALTITMNEGELIADANAENIVSTGGTISTEGDVTVGGEGKISGTTKVLVQKGGTTALAGENDYTGDTIISGKDSTLKVKNGKALGHSKVHLHNEAKLDLNKQALSNYINVTGCELHNASAYTGNLDVSGNLRICGTDATANKVTFTDDGHITPSAGEMLTLNTVDVSTSGNYPYQLGIDTSVKESIVLRGTVLTMGEGATLTLAPGTIIVLRDAAYNKGDILIEGAEGGDIVLAADGKVTMQYGYGVYTKDGNNVVLGGVFYQPLADVFTVNNWGMATASRAFVNAVRGQRNNTACLADGKGTAWFSLLGAKHDISGSDIDLEGAAMGADMKVGKRSVLGVALGYVEGELRPSGMMHRPDSESSYIAVYGEHGLKKLSAASCLTLDWVAAYGTTETKFGSWNIEQDSLQLNTRLNWNKKVNDRLCVRAFGGLEYFANGSDTVDGKKTGSIQNLRAEIGVGASYVAWGVAGVSDAKSGVISGGCNKLVLHGEIRYMNDMVRHNPVIEMDGLRGTGTNPGRQGMGIEAGATYRIGERWSASANYGFNTMEDSREHRLNVGASYTF